MSELSTIRKNGVKYYFDPRLKQLRNVKNPHDYIDLDDEEVTKIQDRIDNRKIKVGLDNGETTTVYSVPGKIFDAVGNGEDPNIIREKGKALFSLLVYKSLS